MALDIIAFAVCVMLALVFIGAVNVAWTLIAEAVTWRRRRELDKHTRAKDRSGE